MGIDTLNRTWWTIIIVTLFIIGLPIGSLFFLIQKNDHYRLNQLHPQVEAAKNQLIKNCQEKQIHIQITQGIRTFAEQNRLYEQGRTKPGKIVTYAKGGQSYHNYGLAIDFVVIDPTTNQPTWDFTFDGNQNGRSDWIEVAEEGKKLGFEWGGDWRGFKDYPHLQMPFGQSIWELQLSVKIRKRWNEWIE